MTFGLYLPEIASRKKVPLLWFLSGLTCTHENAMTKAGAQQWASEKGLALLFPDTSPRGETVPNHDDFDLIGRSIFEMKSCLCRFDLI